MNFYTIQSKQCNDGAWILSVNHGVKTSQYRVEGPNISKSLIARIASSFIAQLQSFDIQACSNKFLKTIIPLDPTASIAYLGLQLYPDDHVKKLLALKPKNLKSTEWFLKQGWLDLLGDHSPLSVQVEDKFCSIKWQSDFFSSFHEPKFSDLHLQSSPAVCAKYLFSSREELLSESSVMAFLKGAKKHLSSDEYNSVHKVIRALWKEGGLPPDPNDSSLEVDIARDAPGCFSRLYYQFRLNPERFHELFRYCRSHEKDAVVKLVIEKAFPLENKELNEITDQTVESVDKKTLAMIVWALFEELKESVRKGEEREFVFFFNDVGAQFGLEALEAIVERSDDCLIVFDWLLDYDYINIHHDKGIAFIKQHPQIFDLYLSRKKKEYNLEIPHVACSQKWATLAEARADYLSDIFPFSTIDCLAPKVIRELENVRRQVNGTPDFEGVYKNAPDACLRYLLENYSDATKTETTAYLPSFKSKLPSSSINYLAREHRSFKDWKNAYNLIVVIEHFFPETSKEVQEQLFSEVLGRYHHPMFQSPDLLRDFQQAAAKIGKSRHKLALFFNSLQNRHSLADIAIALDPEAYGIVFLKSHFAGFQHEKRCKVLTHILVTRQRSGLKIAKALIKSFVNQPTSDKDSLKQLRLALQIVAAIPNDWSLKVAERVVSCLNLSDLEVALAACDAMASCRQKMHTSRLIEALLERLEDPRSSILLKEKIIAALGSFEYRADFPPDKKIIASLIQLETCEQIELRIQLAFTLAKIADVQALETAKKIIKSSDWNRFDCLNESYNRVYLGEHENGLHRLFIGMPEFMKSRTAMLAQILNQQIYLLGKELETNANAIASFGKESQHSQQSRDAAILASKRLCLTNQDLMDVLKFAQSLSLKGEIRFAPISFKYPEHVRLFRGINSRKGDDLFKLALVDLLTYGQQAADLTRLGECYTQGSWMKQGIAFLTHDIDTVLGDYGTADAPEFAAIMEIDTHYVNHELRVHQARWEYEGSVNVALCRGIAREAIKTLYLHESLRNDIEIIANPAIPVDEVHERLAESDLFAGCDKAQIAMLRKRLNEPIQSGNTTTTFYQKIRYCNFADEKSLKVDLGVQNNTFSADDLQKEMVTHFIMQKAMQYVQNPIVY